MDILAYSSTFTLTIFTITWVANWAMNLRSKLRTPPITAAQLAKACAFHIAPWALLAWLALVWQFRNASLFPQIIGGAVSALFALLLLCWLDIARRKRLKPDNPGPRDVA